MTGPDVRRAGADDAAEVAVLLHDFNVEFDTPTPEPPVLAGRLRGHLASGDLVALLAGEGGAGEDAVGVALLSFRASAWSDGPAALLDELYVRPSLRGGGLGTALLDAACGVVRERGGELLEINVDGEDTDARRFYERHGFTHTDPGCTEPCLYYHRELG